MPSPVSAATLASLTVLDESFMTETLTITDTAQTDDGPVAGTERTAIGYFWTLNGDEQGADQIIALGKHRAALPSTTTIAPTATITRANGERYNVKFAFPIGTYSTSRIVGLEDI